MEAPSRMQEPADAPLVPIASLTTSETPPAESSIQATISLIWPYSASTRTAALLLADPDIRQRKNRGQIRVQLAGPAADTFATAQIRIADTIYLALRGAQWVEGDATVQTPGRSVEGELRFKSYISYTVQRDGQVISSVNVHGQDSPIPASPVDRATAPPPQDHGPTLETPAKLGHSNLWNTPTPFRHQFGPSDYSSVDQLDLFGDTDAFEERPAKRIKFGRPSGRWKFVDHRSGSPEKPKVHSSPEPPSAATLSSPQLPVPSPPVTMGPPQLPRLQTEFLPTAYVQPTDLNIQPDSPHLRPIRSAILPAVSPLPYSSLSAPDQPVPVIDNLSTAELLPDQSDSVQEVATFPQPSSPRVQDVAVVNLLSDEDETPNRDLKSWEPRPEVDLSQMQTQFSPMNETPISSFQYFPSLDGVFDEPSIIPSSQRNDPVQSAITISSGEDFSLFSASTSGRAVVHESGAMTPEASQELPRIPELLSMGHRVDDILDGRLPPTPQPSQIPLDMVAESPASPPFIRHSQDSENIEQVSQLQRESEPSASVNQHEDGPNTQDAVVEEPATPINQISAQKTSTMQHKAQPEDNCVDIIAIVSSPASEPQRARAGPKDYFTTLHIADLSVFPTALQVQIFRPYKMSLPSADIGDVILLKQFSVKRRKGDNFLLSTSSSAWCVWRYHKAETESSEVDEECKGAPVDIGAMERERALDLKSWWDNVKGAADHESPNTQFSRSFDAPEQNNQGSNERDVLVAS